MIVFDLEVNGQFIKTLTPEVQRLAEIINWVHDRADELSKEYGENFKLHRKLLVR